MCEFHDLEVTSLDEAKNKLEANFFLYKLCTNNPNARNFNYKYGVILLSTKTIFTASGMDEIDAIKAWTIVMPLFNTITITRDEDGQKMITALFDEFSLYDDKGIGKLLIDGNVYKANEEEMRSEFYHFVHMAFAYKDPVLKKSVETDDRSLSTRGSLAFENDYRRLLAYHRALFYTLSTLYFPRDKRIRELALDLISYKKNWHEIQYVDDMEELFRQAQANVLSLMDVEMRLSIQYINDILSAAIPQSSLLIPNGTTTSIVYPTGDKMTKRSRNTTDEIIKNFILQLTHGTTISDRLRTNITKWLDFNHERLTTTISEQEFNVFYLGSIYDQTSHSDQTLRHGHGVLTAFSSANSYSEALTNAIDELSKSTRPLTIRSGDLFIGTFDIWNTVQRQYEVLNQVEYDQLFSKQFDEALASFSERRRFRQLIEALFPQTDFPQSVIKFLGNIEDAKTLKIGKDMSPVILIIYSAPGFFSARKLNVYIKRKFEHRSQLTVINFSGGLSGMTEDYIPQQDVDTISGILGFTEAQKKKAETLRIDAEILPWLPSSEFSNNGLVWILWYSECVLRKFSEGHIQQFFSMFGEMKYADYIRTTYYTRFIAPKLQ